MEEDTQYFVDMFNAAAGLPPSTAPEPESIAKTLKKPQVQPPPQKAQKGGTYAALSPKPSKVPVKLSVTPNKELNEDEDLFNFYRPDKRRRHVY